MYAEIYLESMANKNSATTDAQETGTDVQSVGTGGVPGMTADTQGTDPAAAPAAPFGQQDIAALGMPHLESLDLATINKNLQQAGLAPLTVDMDLYQEAPDALDSDDPLAQTDESDIMGEQDNAGGGLDGTGNPDHQTTEDAGKSSGDLSWDKVVSKKGETRIDHVNRHSVPNPQRATHGVFNGKTQNIVNQAWKGKGSVVPIDDGMGGEIYNIPFENAGYESGFINTGAKMDYVTIIVMHGTSDIIAAFPSFGDYVK